jgi:hypothetical protein
LPELFRRIDSAIGVIREIAAEVLHAQGKAAAAGIAAIDSGE